MRFGDRIQKFVTDKGKEPFSPEIVTQMNELGEKLTADIQKNKLHYIKSLQTAGAWFAALTKKDTMPEERKRIHKLGPIGYAREVGFLSEEDSVSPAH